MAVERGLWLIVSPAFFVMFVFLSGSVVADVTEGWDWHNVTVGGESKHKRVIHWCWDDSVTDEQKKQWSNWMYLATKNWNSANTGWVVSYSEELCQIVIKFADLKDKPAGQSSPLEVEEDDNGDYWLKKGGITFDSDPSNNDEKPAAGGWGTTGNDTYDPVVVAKHEFGHYLRLDHTVGADDKMNVGDPGYHNHTLSAEDLEEAKSSFGSIGRPITRLDCIFSDYKKNCTSDTNESVGILEGTFEEPTRMRLFKILTWAIPSRTEIAGDWYIASAFSLETGEEETIDLLEFREVKEEEVFAKPVTVRITYTDREIGGGQVKCSPLNHNPIIESEIKAFFYDLEYSVWRPIPGSRLDTSANTVTFETYERGIFGVGGREEEGKGVKEEEYLEHFKLTFMEIIQIPMVSSLIGNERMNIYVDEKFEGHLVTVNNEIASIGKDELEDPTLNIYVDKRLVDGSMEEEITFTEMLQSGLIRLEGVGFVNSLRFAITQFFFNIYSFFSGFSTDMDGDGVNDNFDECPYKPGPPENRGCS